MSDFFKKLLGWRNFSLVKKQKSGELSQEEQLMSKLLEMVHDDKVNEIFYNPVNKLYVFNTYTSDFNDLTSSLYNANFRRQIIAINIHSYFLNSKVDIKTDMEKIANCLRTHKPNMLLQHDLYELVNAYEYLKSLEH